VQALSEAIDLFHSVWDTSTRGGVRLAGEHYRVTGAKRGPKPAHDIPIWVGALKPRMLRLIGEKADGWLPSLARLQEGDLERGNQIIDDAAVTAGRDPSQIRRLVNIHGSFTSDSHGFLHGAPDQWVEELLPFVLEHGISTFILATDDPHAIQRWGGEVAPALREKVERERQESSSRSRSPLDAF
jgi:hypothetical protein